jgi:predicted anti-sigma-YlaC factor YlaD
VTRPEGDPQAEQRRSIVRRATMYTAGFLGAALLIALVGAAFVAWLLTWRGLPFLRTWLIVTAIVVLPGLMAGIWKLIRE